MFDYPFNYIIATIIVLALGLLALLLFGFLWNYHLMMELRDMNKKIDDLTDVIGSNLNKIAKNMTPINRNNSQE